MVKISSIQSIYLALMTYSEPRRRGCIQYSKIVIPPPLLKFYCS